MKISKYSLVSALEPTVRVAAKKSPLALLTHVRMTSDGTILKITGGDGNTWVTESLAGEFDEFDLCAPGSQLLNAVKSMQSVDIDFIAKTSEIELRGGKVKFKLPTLDPEDYPEPDEPKDVFDMEFSMGQWRTAFSATALSVDDGKSQRPGLKCIHFGKWGDDVCLESTNSHRIHRVRVSTTLPNFDVLIPPQIGKEISDLPSGDAEEVTFGVAANGMFRIESGTRVLSGMLTTGNFPNLDKAVGFDVAFTAAFTKKELLKACEVVSMPAQSAQSVPMVVFEPKDQASILIRGRKDLPETADCDVDCDGSTLDKEVAFQSKYIIDALKACPSDSVLLEFKKEGHLKITPKDQDGWIAVLFPMNVA